MVQRELIVIDRDWFLLLIEALWRHAGNRGSLPMTMHPHCGNKKATQQRHLKQSSKNRRKINSTEIMNRSLLWPVWVGHSWDDPSKCVEATNTTLFGHLFKAKKGPSMHILYIYVKTGQKYENSRNYSWGATIKQNITPNLAIQWWILTLWRREENACNLFPNITWQACMPFRNRDYCAKSLKKKGVGWFHA